MLSVIEKGNPSYLLMDVSHYRERKLDLADMFACENCS